MESTLLRESAGCLRSRSCQRVDLVNDDEYSTDSGCSSGGSTGSVSVSEHRSRGCSTGCQERLRQQRKASQGSFKPKSSRSWSPEERRSVRYRAGSSILESPSYSQSPTDTQSSDSDSFKHSFTARSLHKAFQSLKISTKIESTGALMEKSSGKKNQKRILRSPVAYTYVKGLSGLPTQRIPRKAI